MLVSWFQKNGEKKCQWTELVAQKSHQDLRHFFVALKSGLSEQEKNNFLINLHDLIVHANQLTTSQFEKVTGSLYEMLKVLVEKSVPRSINCLLEIWG